MKLKCHLVSFADGAFLNRGSEFAEEAKETGLFDSVSIFKLQDLEQEYRQNHSQFIQANPRGFGCWIWKPQCVLQRMLSVNKDDLIVYMDVGFVLNKLGAYRFEEYCKLVHESEYKFLSFSNTHTEYRWTKADLAHRLNINVMSSHMLTTQLAAGFFILLNTQDNLELIISWRDLAVENNCHYSSDTPSIKQNHACFIEHRHDASISSLLRKIRGTAVTHYEVQSYGHFDKIKKQLPAWALRKK